MSAEGVSGRDKTKPRTSRGFRTIRAAGLAAAIAAAALTALAGSTAHRPLFDLLQNVSPAPGVSRQVHVVAIDPASLRDVGGWPWSRFYLARLVEKIADQGASAIGIDVLLPEPDRLDPALFAALYPELPRGVAAQISQLPSMDATFSRVVGRNPVVLARAGVRRGEAEALSPGVGPSPPVAQFSGLAARGLLDFPAAIANLPIIEGAAFGQGLVNGDRDSDGVIRSAPLVARVGGVPTPGFALELVRVARGADRIVLEGQDGHLDAVRLGGLSIPASPDGQLRLRFGDWRTTQTTSAADVLRRGVAKDLFTGQIVIIGLTSAGASEVASTPRARALDSVYVQAQAVDTILRGTGLFRPRWAVAVEWSFALALAVVALLGVPRAPMTVATGAAGVALITAFGGSWLAFQAGVLLDLVSTLAPAATATAAMIVMLVAQARRAQRRLRLALAAERQSGDERQRLLINELNHRVKNTLATVQSIAVQSLRPERALSETRDAFVSRLLALSAAHNLLNAEHWDSVDLEAIVRLMAAPYDEPPGARFAIAGPRVRLQAQHALGMAMALNELGANAAKYGALSVADGRVSIIWRSGADSEVRFVWQEMGGPAVAPPGRRGFGTRLIQQGLARELGGQAQIDFRLEGLRCEISFRGDAPSPAFHATDGAASPFGASLGHQRLTAGHG